MKLYIPEIGDEIKLTSDWTFDLHYESRNMTMMEFLKDPRWDAVSGHLLSYQKIDSIHPATVPAGTILKVDRIYIRKGLGEFSSITFYWKDGRTPGGMREETDYSSYDKYLQRYTATKMVKIPRKPVRFWAKLADVNNIEFE